MVLPMKEPRECEGSEFWSAFHYVMSQLLYKALFVHIFLTISTPQLPTYLHRTLIYLKEPCAC